MWVPVSLAVMRATVSSRSHLIIVALAAVVLMVLGLDPALSLAIALVGLTVLVIAGFMVSHRLRPRGGFTAALRDAVETQAICAVICAVIGLTVWIGLTLNLRAEWAVLVGVVLAFPVNLAFMRWVLPLLPGFTTASRRIERARRRTGFPVTDHPVSIVEDDPGDGRRGRYLVALCGVEDCGWMEFAPAGDMASQERQLRALAAKHTTAVVPEVKRTEVR